MTLLLRLVHAIEISRVFTAFSSHTSNLDGDGIQHEKASVHFLSTVEPYLTQFPSQAKGTQ
jgi:hypothetical protein